MTPTTTGEHSNENSIVLYSTLGCVCQYRLASIRSITIMTYEELWTAQVRTKARTFAHVYSTLQHLIKSRTKAGYIHGYYKEDCIPGDYQWDKQIKHDSDSIKVNIAIHSYPPRGNHYLSIHFCTKR